MTMKSRLTVRKAAEPEASVPPADKPSLAGISFEELLARMIRRKPPATVKAGIKVKRRPEEHEGGKRAPGDGKLIA